MGDKPEWKARSGRIDLAIWKPREDNKSASCVLQRTRKTKEGDFVRESIRFFENEINDIVAVVDEVKKQMNVTKQ